MTTSVMAKQPVDRHPPCSKMCEPVRARDRSNEFGKPISRERACLPETTNVGFLGHATTPRSAELFGARERDYDQGARTGIPLSWISAAENYTAETIKRKCEIHSADYGHGDNLP